MLGKLRIALKSSKCKKRAIRIITGRRNRDSCRNLFKDLNILLFYSQYTFSLLLFVVNNKSMYKLNSDIHNINTRQKLNLHQHSLNLSLYQKGVYSFGIKVFNNHPQSLKKLTTNSKQFKIALKHYLYTHSFYSIDEYLNVNKY
jgi:hypothetical protein